MEKSDRHIHFQKPCYLTFWLQRRALQICIPKASELFCSFCEPVFSRKRLSVLLILKRAFYFVFAKRTQPRETGVAWAFATARGLRTWALDTRMRINQNKFAHARCRTQTFSTDSGGGCSTLTSTGSLSSSRGARIWKEWEQAVKEGGLNKLSENDRSSKTIQLLTISHSAKTLVHILQTIKTLGKE